MNELQALYQKVILDHQKHPRNFGTLENPTHHNEKDNPICGDQIQIEVNLNGETIDDLRFKGFGCAICMASTSLMTELLLHQSLTHAQEAFAYLKTVIAPDEEPQHTSSKELQSLHAFEGVKKFPSRVQCATLGWEALLEVMPSNQEVS